MIIRLKEKGEGEEVTPPLGEMGAGGAVEPAGLVLVGEEGVHRWSGERGEGRGEGMGLGLYNWNTLSNSRPSPDPH